MRNKYVDETGKNTPIVMNEQVDFDKIEITDDIMFGSVFKNEIECKEFLQRILAIEIQNIKVVEAQKTMKATYTGKGIRLDIYAKDVEGNVYDIEMQTTSSRELPLRSRYYHSEMDSYQIREGKKYTSLKQSVVIFVCKFDPFEDNRSIYTFNTFCKENKELRLDDKRHTYFVNVHGNREGMPQHVINLLDYFKTGKPTDSYTEKLHDQVERYRRDDEWRDNYMTIEMKMDEKFEEGKKIGRAEGEKYAIQKLVQSWLKKGKTISEIARELDYSEESVENLIALDLCSDDVRINNDNTGNHR